MGYMIHILLICLSSYIYTYFWQLSFLFRTQCQFTGLAFMQTDFWNSWARLYLKKLIVSHCTSTAHGFSVFSISILNLTVCVFFVCLSFKRSIFEKEEEFSPCTQIKLSGGSVRTKRDKGGEEGPKYGPPWWKLYVWNKLFTSHFRQHTCHFSRGLCVFDSRCAFVQ